MRSWCCSRHKDRCQQTFVWPGEPNLKGQAEFQLQMAFSLPGSSSLPCLLFHSKEGAMVKGSAVPADIGVSVTACAPAWLL